MSMRRIVRIHQTGGPEVLQLEAVDPEAPRDGEVLLRVCAIGLNNSEGQYRRGEYPMKETVFPTRIGRECCGEVVAVGPGVTDIATGRLYSTIPAFDIQRNGVYGEWAVVPAQALVPVPAGLTTVQAAAVWQQYLTAFGPLIEYADLKPGEWVLITAAASSVGRGALQVARLLGCRVIATTRSAHKAEVLRKAGAEHVVVTPGENLVDAVRECTGGQGVRLTLDPIAGTQMRAICEASGNGAAVFLYGQLAREPVDFPLLTCIAKGLTVRGYTLWELTLDAAKRARGVEWISARLTDGRLAPVIDRVFRLDEIGAAHAYLESGMQNGKIVVEVG